MHQQTKFGRGCQLHQQLSLGQYFGGWEIHRLQYKTEWDCFRSVMFLIHVACFSIFLATNIHCTTTAKCFYATYSILFYNVVGTHRQNIVFQIGNRKGRKDIMLQLPVIEFQTKNIEQFSFRRFPLQAFTKGYPVHN